MNGIKIKFWGERGSFPIPKCDDAFGGNNYCVEVRSNKKEILGFLGDMKNRWTVGGNNKKQNDPFKLGGSGQLFGMQTGKSPNSSDPSKIYKNLAKQSNTTVWWND